MIRKEMPQIMDWPTTDDNVQKRQRKRLKETQNTERNKTDQTPSRPHPAQKDWSNNIYYKQWINNNRTTALNSQHH